MIDRILLELKRYDLLSKTKTDTPERYSRRLYYKSKQYKIIDFDTNSFIINGHAQIKLLVGSYQVTIVFQKLLDELRKYMIQNNISNLSHKSLRSILPKVLDNTDVLIDCTCPDFGYRYAYWATVLLYKAGTPETRPSHKTNPSNKGAMCKHATAVLSNKRWTYSLTKYVYQALLQLPPYLRWW